MLHMNIPSITYTVSICPSFSLQSDRNLTFKPSQQTSQVHKIGRRKRSTSLNSIILTMSSRTHFRNETDSVFSKLECQLACALHLYIRTRRHRRSRVDHSQPPTLEMLNGIMEEARWMIWDGARRGAPCNPMPPDAYLNAYCLVRNVRDSPNHQGWYDEVRNYPEFWSDKASTVFDNWVHANSALVEHLRRDGTLARYY